MQRDFPDPVAILTMTSLCCSNASVTSIFPGRQLGYLKYVCRVAFTSTSEKLVSDSFDVVSMEMASLLILRCEIGMASNESTRTNTKRVSQY